jgi:hypothetical protein
VLFNWVVNALSDEQSVSERHSFVIKIWPEEVHKLPGQVKWRGHITHVGTGERQYLERLDEIASFIGKFLSMVAPGEGDPGTTGGGGK